MSIDRAASSNKKDKRHVTIDEKIYLDRHLAVDIAVPKRLLYSRTIYIAKSLKMIEILF
jgi:hypothetical protein